MSVTITVFLRFNKPFSIKDLNEKMIGSPYLEIPERSVSKSEFVSLVDPKNDQFFNSAFIKYKGNTIPVSLEYISSNIDIVFLSNYYRSDSSFFMEHDSFYLELKKSIKDCVLVGHDNFFEISHLQIIEKIGSSESLVDLGASIF